MLCTFCNTARLANEAPCPHCGAPSPLIGATNNLYRAAMPQTATWEGSTSSLSSNVQVSNQVQQVLPQTPQTAPPAGQQQVSLLPVPYQPQQGVSTLPQGSLMEGNSLISMPVQNIGALLPTLPQEEGIIYVPPMYTKPRAIIPGYRAISGLLSVLIVTILLCTGAGYYVKASGKLAALSQMYGLVPPPNVNPAPATALPNPPTNQETGPAYNIINSATTTSKINGQSVATQHDTVFKPGQTIYLTYSVQHPKTSGVVVIKWYTNKVFYQASHSPLISTTINGTVQQEYAQPAEGMVELYLNDQLAIRLFFVVR